MATSDTGARSRRTARRARSPSRWPGSTTRRAMPGGNRSTLRTASTPSCLPAAGGEVLNAREHAPGRHQQTLDMRRAVHGRDSVFQARGNEIQVRSERFLSLDDVHLMAMKYQVKTTRAETLVIRTGVDSEVWDINGPHGSS